MVPADKLLSDLQSRRTGLFSAEAAGRLKGVGPNVIGQKASASR
ncbi:cation-transporting P-type ATPase [Mesorhizobium sp. CCNWLW176]